MLSPGATETELAKEALGPEGLKAYASMTLFKRMGDLLGPLHQETYAHVDEVRGDAYGFAGLTQERRYIAGKLETALERAA